jgi:radical SAM superfamily enzyme YgiQ (UPF0313 family)
MAEILLTTLNAKWIHASFGLRYLRANLGELRARSAIAEFDLQRRPADVAEAILAHAPRIVGLGVYVWNAAPCAEVVQVLKRVRPDLLVVLGGPEVSFETDRQPMCALADYVVRGEGDLAFAALCRALLAGGRPASRVIDAPLPHFAELAWPYDEYGDGDVAHRIVYVESSRGCPFTCEFCLSSLDVPVRQAPVEGFLAQMQRLLDRGVRHFKFVDRTFNLNLGVARAILRFFRERLRDGLFLHFEMIPDRLPPALRDELAAFPPGALQFEVGVQTLDDTVSERIARRQDVGRLADNLRFLREHTGVHVHADLIVGLPGEDLATFGRGFDRLLALRPHEIQVGILKRLRGTPIVRHDAEFEVVWSEVPPYEVLQTKALTFAELQRLTRFARYWDVVANSGNWPATLAELLAGPSAFDAFLQFSDWLHAQTDATHGIAMHRLAALLFRWLCDERGVDRDAAGRALAGDYGRGARHDWPEFLRPWVQPGRPPSAPAANPGAERQARHGP